MVEGTINGFRFQAAVEERSGKLTNAIIISVRPASSPEGGTGVTELYWDPFDTAIDLDPHPMWRRMREELPVYRNERFGFFALSRYADVEAAHLDHETFSSAHGTVLELITPDPYPAAPMIFMDP